jgi:hypothetical protein
MLWLWSYLWKEFIVNSSQIRHANSIAKHMVEFSQPFVKQMEAFAAMGPDDLSWMTVAEFKARVNTHLGGMLTELEQVIDDMYPGFPPDFLSSEPDGQA